MPDPQQPLSRKERRQAERLAKRMERQAQQQAQEVRQTFIRTSKKAIAWTVSVFALVVGIVSGVLTLLPQGSVSVGSPLDPADPFTTPFIVSNTGYSSIHDVKYFCRLNDLNHHGTRTKNIATKTTSVRTR